MGFYRRRHPERSDYYRLLESGFEAFARNWPEDFESRYGFLRKEVQGAVFAFLECGIPENGVARVRCSGCGHDFFVAFSCRSRVVCPSCTARRSLLFGENVREIVHPLNHRHLTFTKHSYDKLQASYFQGKKLYYPVTIFLEIILQNF